VRRLAPFATLFLTLTLSAAQVPENLVADGVPPFAPELAAKVRPYLEYRTASFGDWHPDRAEMLISTRFGNTPQIHYVKMPGGARTQLTFRDERSGQGTFLPGNPNIVLFSSDVGGAENFQIYALNRTTGVVDLLTDGKSRNLFTAISGSGKLIGYGSNQRKADDIDIWVMDPMNPKSARMVAQMEGGGWGPYGFSPDDKQLLLARFTSASDAEVWTLDLASGVKRKLAPNGTTPSTNYNPHFSRDGKWIYYLSNAGGEFIQLVRIPAAGGTPQVISHEPWDVEDYDGSWDSRRVAYVTNENGLAVLHVADADGSHPLALPKLPAGEVDNPTWHRNNRLLGFTVTSAKSPSDAYSLDVVTGNLVRWTESETGGVDASRNVEPRLVTFKSFDGTQISAFVYDPDPAKFPGKRPAVMIIHGGPEGQSRPGFLGRNNYLINELGIALVYPNVRGSSGYGKTFLEMDNGFKREDSVKDIGALLDWIATDSRLDASRVGVYGGSYGGYMTLAVATHYNDRIRAAIDVVGISNFLTFMQNTSGYRRDLRRVEYGDERDPKMHEFLERVSPIATAKNITKPLFVIAGFNDPRVPWTEGEQMVKTVRANGGPVWWLMAKDEGHGFSKKPNVDWQFLAMTEFWEQFLLK
jgi:dipeptidyl aminopeptidase/acylaminoacyl peptidase